LIIKNFLITKSENANDKLYTLVLFIMMPITQERITHYVTKLVDSHNEIVLLNDGFRNVIGNTEDLSKRVFSFVFSPKIHHE